MINNLFAANPLRLFYLVFGYIIAFSIWWGYLLFAKNETAFQELVALNKLNHQQTNNLEQPYEHTAEYKAIEKKYIRQKIMILSEGTVFIVLLVMGLLIVHRVFKKELELAEQQKNFLHSITHELKSPLSSIKLSFQTILKRSLEPRAQEQIVGNALIDVVRLEALVDNILFAAKMEKDTHGFSNEELNATDLVAHEVSKLQDNKKGVRITMNLEEKILLQTDKLGFTSVILNLLENAIKYSEANSTVQVELSKKNGQVLLRIADQGIGIPAEERTKVFDKFYRIGSENTRNTKGTGLGLYIVKRFVEIYKGEITVEANTPKGSVFTLRLPQS